MTPFDYEKLFEPFARDGYPLEKVIEWLKDKTKADDQIIGQVVSDTMQLLSQGEKFELPCPCGCEMDYPDATISHFMLARVFELQARVQKSKIEILQEVEKTRLEARQRLLSNFDKEYNKMLNGTFLQKFKKFIGAKYDHWDKE